MTEEEKIDLINKLITVSKKLDEFESKYNQVEYDFLKSKYILASIMDWFEFHDVMREEELKKVMLKAKENYEKENPCLQ